MISILTTVKNGYEFLEECAASIFLQRCDYRDLHIQWEWWIGINGHGETGGPAAAAALKIKEAWPQYKIHVVNMPEVEGRVAALNTLCSKTCGEWIAILDCDDMWEEDKLITQMIAVQMGKTPIDIIGTHCTYFGSLGPVSPRLPSGWISLDSTLSENPIINSSVLIRRETAIWEDRYGLEDYDLWIRSAKSGKTLFNVPHSLVRHRIHTASAFNASSGVQDLEGLRKFHRLCSPTVVSAYYPVKSKFSIEQYMKWIVGFWPKTSCSLVFYTEPLLVGLFEKAFASRKNVKIVGLPFTSLSAFEKLSYKVWLTTKALDKETGHTPELYALWYEKKEFVLRTILENPFSSDKFIWCDAGIGRIPELTLSIQKFPVKERIPRGTMLILEIDPLNEKDCGRDVWGIPGTFDTVATFGGGILASDAEGWIRWSKAYDSMLIRYYLAGRFIGKDQNIMASMILEDPSLATIVHRPADLGPIAGWFYLLCYLSVSHTGI
jgi:glycosyltransferase involved in cell wall biosynthesis